MTTTNASIDQWLDAGRTLPDGTKMTNERMNHVFDMVNPSMVSGARSWKYPLDVVIDPAEASADEIRLVVAWFCGGHPDITERDGKLHVTGAGYYGWVGA